MERGEVVRCIALVWSRCAIFGIAYSPNLRPKTFQLKDGRFGEVQYFFCLRKMVEDGGTDDVDFALAMVSLFTSPGPAIAHDTYGALMACRYQGDHSREVVDAHEIMSVVAMVPLPPRREELEDPHFARLYSDRFFVVEKLGFDMTWIGRDEAMAEEEGPEDND
ncbi:hypothetical protein LXA43DRAFT_895213 [Ganoderma leucocontextum]|nr:hypothetical protein LXA43DRAFT_895213 [Ganoderma leucocontextum]